MGIEIDFEEDLGWNYIGAVMAAVPEELDANLLPKALMTGAYKLRGRIQREARQAFDWGHHAREGRARGLYDSIRVGRPTPEHWPDPYIRVGASYARQVYLIEHGHQGAKPAPPHPFIIPAILQGEPELVRTVTDYMRQKWASEVMTPALKKGKAESKQAVRSEEGDPRARSLRRRVREQQRAVLPELQSLAN